MPPFEYIGRRHGYLSKVIDPGDFMFLVLSDFPC